ncbi:MAG TPA: argininosuccinate lyase [Spirochaetota bacterium]|nr:argininosuccinate lyase [Spirochaetota bacterium]
MPDSSKDSKKLWGGRFDKKTSSITEKISSSIQFDKVLYRQDIRGSMVHAKMLNKIGVLTDDDYKNIIRGLEDIRHEIEVGSFEFSTSLEDIHMNIESRLTEMIGEAGKRLHTGRSRNDQIALDFRLFIIDACNDISLLLKRLILELVTLANSEIDTVMPGYTHMQVAQPVRFSHHMLAHAWALVRDLRRLEFTLSSCDNLPLGSGAMAGVNYSSDREMLRKELDFSEIIPNSMDGVSDRDFALDFLYFASMLGMHLSRFCEELVIWSSSEFSFIRLSDTVTTGSSIMPQKRNPDIAELIRGKTGRLYGDMISLFTVMKSLPLTYNRDFQEDKEPVFDAVETVMLSLEGMIEMISSMEVNSHRLKETVYSNFSTATDLADYLVQKGVPFRQSHEVIGNIVRYCENEKKDFFSLKLEEMKKFSDMFEADAVDAINPETSTERKVSYGSTSKESVQNQIKMLQKILEG